MWVKFTQGVEIGHTTSETKAKTYAALDPRSIMEFLADWDRVDGLEATTNGLDE